MTETIDAIAVVLAINSGGELAPLTENRTAAAMPFGGNFRLIDFPLSNCLNSGLRKVLVLTQYKSHSLHKHLRDGWSIFIPELREFITPVPPQMRDGPYGYRGPVDALRQCLFLLERNSADHVLVVGGDEIYRMDYAAMLRSHKACGADMTIACPLADVGADAGGAPYLCVDADERVTAVQTTPAAGAHWIRSMGVAVFSKAALSRMLAAVEPATLDCNDVGRELLPRVVNDYRVMAYRFGGTAGRVTPDRFWCRPTSVDDFYAANMALLDFEPPIDLYQSDWPLRTYHMPSPPARMAPGRSCAEGVCINSIVAAGTIVAGGGVHRSILFPGVIVDDGAIVEDCILMSGVRVGAGAVVRRCVVEKGIEIPAGVELGGGGPGRIPDLHVSPGGVTVVTGADEFDWTQPPPAQPRTPAASPRSLDGRALQAAFRRR